MITYNTESDITAYNNCINVIFTVFDILQAKYTGLLTSLHNVRYEIPECFGLCCIFYAFWDDFCNAHNLLLFMLDIVEYECECEQKIQ